MKRFIKFTLPLVMALTLVGCGNEEEPVRYDNVLYNFNTETYKYDVQYGELYWEVGIENVYTLYVKNYPQHTDGTHLAYNSFYVNGKSYKLFVYNVIKQ